MSQEELERSEERQVNSQLQYINYTAEEILQNKLNDKKRKLGVVSNAINTVSEIEENDEVHIPGLENTSVGSHIKNKALEKYQSFSHELIQQQTMISLGMNSILDLTYSFGNAQSTLFFWRTNGLNETWCICW